jgi:hypothetical protein
MRWWRVAAVVASAVMPAAASAGEPYYFNRAGVTRDVYVADVNECAELAGGVRVARQYVYTPNLYAAAAAGLFSGLMQGAERRRLHAAVERICMADKGYRRLTIDKAALKSIRELEEGPRLDRLFDLASSSTPLGPELPE